MRTDKIICYLLFVVLWGCITLYVITFNRTEPQPIELEDIIDIPTLEVQGA